MRMAAAVAVLDVAAVVLFVAIGRASHGHAGTVGGFVSTAWPFAAGLGLGWLACLRRPPASLRAGLVVCTSTVVVGMALRVLAGQGTAAAFVAVALGFLGAVMLGGRLLCGAGRRLWPFPARPG